MARNWRWQHTPWVKSRVAWMRVLWVISVFLVQWFVSCILPFALVPDAPQVLLPRGVQKKKGVLQASAGKAKDSFLVCLTLSLWNWSLLSSMSFSTAFLCSSCFIRLFCAFICSILSSSANFWSIWQKNKNHFEETEGTPHSRRSKSVGEKGMKQI